MADGRDLRVRSRVRMDLPVRVRQIGPPRDVTEVTHTLDVSRNGILFRTREMYDPRETVWVTMPYRPNAIANEPEFPGSVVRMDRKPDGYTEVALQFHSGRADQMTPLPTRTAAPISSSEKRSKSRVRMTLPIRVREGPETHAEESTTIDVSRTGVLFHTARNYPAGQKVWVAMPYQPGAVPEEVEARVVRAVERGGLRGVAIEYAARMAARGAYRGF